LLTYDTKAVERDLPDFVAIMLATRLRIGECGALRWENVDLNAGTVTVQSTVVQLQGRGVTVKPTKSAAGVRTLALPSWCVQMLRARPRTDPVFPAPMGGWRDPSYTQADLREAFAEAGFGWITSHTFRKTVATLMDKAGLSARAAADQAGNVQRCYGQLKCPWQNITDATRHERRCPRAAAYADTPRTWRLRESAVFCRSGKSSLGMVELVLTGFVLP
jgi:site-specific recombinase XerC